MALPFSLWGVFQPGGPQFKHRRRLTLTGAVRSLPSFIVTTCYNSLHHRRMRRSSVWKIVKLWEYSGHIWPWHDRHDIAWNILKQSCSFNSFQVLMEVGIPVHFNFDGDAMLLELQAKLQGDFERHGRNKMPFKNCDRELQFVANHTSVTSDLHWTFFRALSIVSIAVDSL